MRAYAVEHLRYEAAVPNPHSWQQWLGAMLIAAGWILATTIAAGLTRTLARR